MRTMGEFLREWHEFMLLNPAQRVGQSLFNFTRLHPYTKHVAEGSVGSIVDPFYDDSKVLDFLTLINEECYGG